ncbi:amino acid ABC transporter ATP-binding protein [Propionibacterium freudenreichii]|uniref:amino acid ABC transporter ATP-binding protein n=1 Tax=Propionibacterium freudenreichii TaxID=1744 RepID=UPI000BC33CE1|nr:ABC transporter related protein [Propionibacterium freudenreichii]SCQ79110.1 ABC transporter related protein [Propionibacterium freudenreichii]
MTQHVAAAPAAAPAVRMPGDYAIELGGIRKSYGDHEVLKGVSLRVKQGEVCSIIGPSGAGKSTLLRCVNLLEEPDHGNMIVDGQYMQGGINHSRKELLELRRRVGMVFQSFNLFPHMTVLDNIVLPQRRVLKRSPEAARDKGRELLDKVGLADKADSYPAKLSGGQQQRVAIARALALEPSAMLFDEPTSALDPELAHGVLNVMKEVAVTGMTMMVVTHEMNFARTIGDHLVVMEDGAILEEGDPEKVMSHPEKERTAEFLSAVINR